MERDIVDRAKEAFAVYRGLGRQIVDDLIAELEKLRAAARAFDDNLSTDCDGPERDDLRRLLPRH